MGHSIRYQRGPFQRRASQDREPNVIWFNQMDLLAFVLFDDQVNEIAELDPVTAFVVLAGHLSGVNVERREQG